MSIKDFFYFNKSDRKALIFLLTVGICATALFFLLSDEEKITTGASERDTVFVKEPGRSYYSRSQPVAYYRVEGRQVELFPFDPNTADSTDLLRLGLQPWQVRNIYKYRAAGGVYRKTSDFARLYGLTRKQYLAMEPYIHISSDYLPASTLAANAAQTPELERDTIRFPIKIKSTEHVALNAADTSMLKKVPGIGSYFARQIVNYRTRLGGFCNTRQLLEIEDFPEEALTYFSLTPRDASQIHRLPINKLSISQLKRHPYMGYYRARAIADYRRLKGPIHRLEDLGMLKDFTPEAIERLKPYVSFEE